MRKATLQILYNILLITACCCCFINNASGQVQPFYDDIQTFKKQDSTSFPPKHAILFIGSSSFTNWTDVQDYFPKHRFFNRGFGGSTLTDALRKLQDLTFASIGTPASLKSSLPPPQSNQASLRPS